MWSFHLTLLKVLLLECCLFLSLLKCGLGLNKNKQNQLHKFNEKSQLQIESWLFNLLLHDFLPWALLEAYQRSEEHTSELQSRFDLVCRLLLDKRNYSQ